MQNSGVTASAAIVFGVGVLVLSVIPVTPVVAQGRGERESVTIQSFNHRESFMQHEHGLGFVLPVKNEHEWKNARFYLVPGLADPTGVSLLISTKRSRLESRGRIGFDRAG